MKKNYMFPFSPTSRGWVMIFLSVSSLGVCLANVNIATGITAAAFAAVVMASLSMSIFSISKIDMRRTPGVNCSVGERIFLPVIVRNRGRFTRQSFVISERIPFAENPAGNTAVEALTPGEQRIINREFMPCIRGSYSLENIHLIGGDPGGLFRRVITFKIPEEITVYPETSRIVSMPIFKKNRIQASTSSKPIGVTGVGEDFFGVREFRHSDSIRFIHWKATAKQRKLMVREYDAHSHVTLAIVLDSERKKCDTYNNLANNNFEFLVKTAATICNYACGIYCRIVFISPDGRTGETAVFEGTGVGLRNEIMGLLADIQLSDTSLDDLMETTGKLLTPNSTLYCLTLSENPELQHSFDFLLSRGVDIHWLYAPKENFNRFIAPNPKKGDVETEYSDVNTRILDLNSNIQQVLTYG